MLQSKEHMPEGGLLSTVHPLAVFVVISPVRPDNKWLINLLAESIKEQGKSMKSAPAFSSLSSQLSSFCRACLRYKKSSQLFEPCLS